MLSPPEGQTVLDGLEFKVALGNTWKENLTELSGGQRLVNFCAENGSRKAKTEQDLSFPSPQPSTLFCFLLNCPVIFSLYLLGTVEHYWV